MIINVAYKVVSGTGAEDVRSDDEEEEDEAEDEESSPTSATHMRKSFLASNKPLIEEEVGVEELRLSDRKSRFKKHSSTASGVSLNDRKELLGRIGCDKQA